MFSCLLICFLRKFSLSFEFLRPDSSILSPSDILSSIFQYTFSILPVHKRSQGDPQFHSCHSIFYLSQMNGGLSSIVSVFGSDVGCSPFIRSLANYVYLYLTFRSLAFSTIFSSLAFLSFLGSRHLFRRLGFFFSIELFFLLLASSFRSA